MPTVHVLAEDPVRRTNLRCRVSANPPVLVVVAAAATVEEALELCRRTRNPGRVVVVADAVSPSAIYQAFRAGVSAILRTGDARPDRLATIINAAATGPGPRLQGELNRPLDEAPTAITPAPLTTREIHLLRLVADGYGNADIARQLKCSPHTVKNTIHDIMTRLRLRNRTHAAAFAVRSGLA